MNHLDGALSPYLQQHADNPVDWYEWGPEAFDEARRRDVPIFLSVGYAACHWCHVMAHESFEDPATAQLLNDHFVSIKVDREERPDIDAVYMAATTAMTGHGGWPMSVWLDHSGRAFHAGTYFPPEPMRGRPSFIQILGAVTDAWTQRRDAVLDSARAINDSLAERESGGLLPGPGAAPEQIMAGAVEDLAAAYDNRYGGFGGAPKFPPAMTLEFLLRHYERAGDQRALDLVVGTCEAMARGGIYDQLAGGFARYSVDAQWLVPHFEKMLYDNALLLRVYTHAWCRTDSDLFRRIAEETAEFLIRDLGTPEGAFAAALDADAAPPDDPAGQPVEGASYVWTPDQLDAVLGPDDGQWAADLFRVGVAGNFEHGTSTLTLPQDPADHRRFDDVRARLLAARASRPQPMRDDKVVASWNGLAITALVQAGVVFDRPEWVDAAARAAQAVSVHHLTDDHRLMRVSRGTQQGSAPGALEDYGNVIEGFAWVFAATGDVAVIRQAEILTQVMIDRFSQADGGFADTPDDGEVLVRRPRDPSDNASPSGLSAAVMALVTMAALTGRAPWGARAEQALSSVAELQQNHPRFAGWSLAALAAWTDGPTQVALVAEPSDPAFVDLRRAAFRGVRSGGVIATGSGEPIVALLADRPLRPHATAYVCRDFVCHLPVTRDDDLAQQLESPPR